MDYCFSPTTCQDAYVYWQAQNPEEPAQSACEYGGGYTIGLCTWSGSACIPEEDVACVRWTESGENECVNQQDLIGNSCLWHSDPVSPPQHDYTASTTAVMRSVTTGFWDTFFIGLQPVVLVLAAILIMQFGLRWIFRVIKRFR